MNQKSQTVDLTVVTGALANSYETIKTTTSVPQVAYMLNYLAECDFAQANTCDNLDGDILYGRGYLLQMLSEGLHHFSHSFEGIMPQFNQLKLQMQQQIQSLESRQKQIVQLSEIKQTYEQLVALDDKDGEQAQQLRQQLLALNEQLASS